MWKTVLFPLPAPSGHCRPPWNWRRSKHNNNPSSVGWDRVQVQVQFPHPPWSWHHNVGHTQSLPQQLILSHMAYTIIKTNPWSSSSLTIHECNEHRERKHETKSWKNSLIKPTFFQTTTLNVSVRNCKDVNVIKICSL